MSHVFKDKPRLVARVRRIKGQVEAIERALEGDGADCMDVLQLVASVRGAINGFRDAVDDIARRQGADELIQILRTYMK